MLTVQRNPDFHTHTASHFYTGPNYTPRPSIVQSKAPTMMDLNHFPSILHNMLTEIENNQHGCAKFVSWQPHGKCFLIKNKEEFIAQVLPMWYCRLKYSTFERQLHKHGFRKLARKGPDQGGFYHPKFTRGNLDAARTIHPTGIKGRRGRKPNSKLTEPDFYDPNWTPPVIPGQTPSPQTSTANVAEAPAPFPALPVTSEASFGSGLQASYGTLTAPAQTGSMDLLQSFSNQWQQDEVHPLAAASSSVVSLGSQQDASCPPLGRRASGQSDGASTLASVADHTHESGADCTNCPPEEPDALPLCTILQRRDSMGANGALNFNLPTPLGCESSAALLEHNTEPSIQQWDYEQSLLESNHQQEDLLAKLQEENQRLQLRLRQQQSDMTGRQLFKLLQATAPRAAPSASSSQARGNQVMPSGNKFLTSRKHEL